MEILLLQMEDYLPSWSMDLSFPSLILLHSYFISHFNLQPRSKWNFKSSRPCYSYSLLGLLNHCAPFCNYLLSLSVLTQSEEDNLWRALQWNSTQQMLCVQSLQRDSVLQKDRVGPFHHVKPEHESVCRCVHLHHLSCAFHSLCFCMHAFQQIHEQPD